MGVVFSLTAAENVNVFPPSLRPVVIVASCPVVAGVTIILLSALEDGAGST